MKFSDINLTDEYNYGAIFVGIHKRKQACMFHVYLGMTGSGKYCFMLLPSINIELYNLAKSQYDNELIEIIGREFWNDKIFFSHDIAKFKNYDDIDSVPFMDKLRVIGMIKKDFVYEIRNMFKEQFNN